MLSLGEISTISLGGISYNLQFAEVYLFSLLLLLFIKSLKSNFVIETSSLNKIMYIGWSLVLFYSFLILFWSDEGLTPAAGSLSLIWGLSTFILADHYFRLGSDIYLKGSRLLLLSMFVQLFINMIPVFTVTLDFYSLKTYSNTFMGNSNFISFFFSFFFLYEIIAKNKKWLLYSCLSLMGIMLTISRGAIVAIAIALMVYFLISLMNKHTNKFKVILNLGFIILFTSLWFNFTSMGRELWFSMQFGLEASSVGSREILWNQAIETIKNNILGVGIVWRDDPHNIILSSYRGLGILFGTIYILIISFPLFYFLNPCLIRYSNKTIAILIAYLSVFVHSMIEIFYLTSLSSIWVALTLAFISKTLRDELKELKKQKTEPDVSPIITKKRRRIVWN